MEPLKIYRKRLIPKECIWLKDDIVLLCNEEYIVSRWTTLRPRKDFTHIVISEILLSCTAVI